MRRRRSERNPSRQPACNASRAPFACVLAACGELASVVAVATPAICTAGGKSDQCYVQCLYNVMRGTKNDSSDDFFLLTIGEAAQRTSVPATTIRAWERRYGVPSPTRTNGGYRLYGRQALDEIASLLRHRAAGIRPQQAALLVRHGRTAGAIPKEQQRLRSWRHRLERACLRFDDAGANVVVGNAAHEVGLLSALKDVVLPVVAQLGDAWHEGLINISQSTSPAKSLSGSRYNYAAWTRPAGHGRR